MISLWSSRVFYDVMTLWIRVNLSRIRVLNWKFLRYLFFHSRRRRRNRTAGRCFNDNKTLRMWRMSCATRLVSCTTYGDVVTWKTKCYVIRREVRHVRRTTCLALYKHMNYMNDIGRAPCTTYDVVACTTWYANILMWAKIRGKGKPTEFWIGSPWSIRWFVCWSVCVSVRWSVCWCFRRSSHYSSVCQVFIKRPTRPIMRPHEWL